MMRGRGDGWVREAGEPLSAGDKGVSEKGIGNMIETARTSSSTFFP